MICLRFLCRNDRTLTSSTIDLEGAMRRSLRDSLMSRSALRSCRQQLLTAVLPTQLGLCYRIRYGIFKRSEDLAQRLADVKRAGALLPDTRFLDGREFAE